MQVSARVEADPVRAAIRQRQECPARSVGVRGHRAIPRVHRRLAARVAEAPPKAAARSAPATTKYARLLARPTASDLYSVYSFLGSGGRTNVRLLDRHVAYSSRR
jgi:hypothetical protein